MTISHYVDHFLVPLVLVQKQYIYVKIVADTETMVLC